MFDKGAFHEYSPYVYTEKDDTFKSLPKPRKNKDIVTGTVQIKTTAQ